MKRATLPEGTPLVRAFGLDVRPYCSPLYIQQRYNQKEI